MTQGRATLVGSIRTSRRWHRGLGLLLAALVLVSAVTGVLLGWKKQSEWLQPGTQRGSPGELSAWLPLADLEASAKTALAAELGPHADLTVDRMDVRPDVSTVKVRFERGDWEAQIDGITGRVLNLGQRNADWIERIHDGSIVSEAFKLGSMNVLGFGLLLMLASGLWLWYGPKRIRNKKRVPPAKTEPSRTAQPLG